MRLQTLVALALLPDVMRRRHATDCDDDGSDSDSDDDQEGDITTKRMNL